MPKRRRPKRGVGAWKTSSIDSMPYSWPWESSWLLHTAFPDIRRYSSSVSQPQAALVGMLWPRPRVLFRSSPGALRAALPAPRRMIEGNGRKERAEPSASSSNLKESPARALLSPGGRSYSTGSEDWQAGMSLNQRSDQDLQSALTEAITDDMPNDGPGSALRAGSEKLTMPPTAHIAEEHDPHVVARSSTVPPSTSQGEEIEATSPTRTWQPPPIEVPASPSTSAAQSSFMPVSEDGVFIRRPGQVWHPMDQPDYLSKTPPGALTRRYSSFSRASAAASLNGVLSTESSPSRPTAELQGELADNEDTPLTKGLQSIWDRLSKLAISPDADGIVRNTPSSPTDGRTSNEEAATTPTPTSTFFDAMTTLRQTLGFSADETASWTQAQRSELQKTVDHAERAEAASEDRKNKDEDIEVKDGEHGSKTLIRKQDAWETPKLPVCFSHGLFGFDQLTLMPSVTISYWRGIVEVLEANGCEVLVCRVPTAASVPERAAALKQQIEERFPGREVNLVGHSMGGLDCRYLVSQLRPSFKVRSLTTITTPHRGSSFCDYMLDSVIGRERLPKLLSLLKTVNLPGGGRAFENLTTYSMEEFNKRVTDQPGTKYFSWGASFEPSLFNEFRIPHGIIYEKEGPNDGLVSVESAKWGQYMGTLQDVSHLQIVGWRAAGPLTKLAFGSADVFSATNFYLQICEDLAREGY